MESRVRLQQWGAGAVLAVAVLATVMMAVLRQISMAGVDKTFGHFRGWTFLIVISAYFVVALFDLLTIPVTLFVGIFLLVTSIGKNRTALFCAMLTCMLSAGNLLFWLFYCGGIPGTAQRPFP
jgi:hypothetical protein